MGGDHAPQAPVAGALDALAELDASHTIQLVGQRASIEAEIDRLGRSSDGLRKRLETVDAADIITDFNHRDLLDLGRVARTSRVPLTFIGWNAFSGVPGQVNYSLIEYWKCDLGGHCYDGYFTLAQADLTGAGVADFCINLFGRHFLKARNFVLGPAVNQPGSS